MGGVGGGGGWVRGKQRGVRREEEGGGLVMGDRDLRWKANERRVG